MLAINIIVIPAGSANKRVCVQHKFCDIKYNAKRKSESITLH
jgi:hypothetical protein